MFRLYNSAFARFPDADGLRYWINNFSSGTDDERAVYPLFLFLLNLNNVMEITSLMRRMFKTYT